MHHVIDGYFGTGVNGYERFNTMKQHITRNQFEELSIDGQHKLFNALFPNIPMHPMSLRGGIKYGPVDINPEYLTIGRMIEFLEEQKVEWPTHLFGTDHDGKVYFAYYKNGNPIPEFCDALWETVKERLI